MHQRTDATSGRFRRSTEAERLESLHDRFWTMFVVVENCWEWIGAITGNGYGGFSDGKRYGRAHRIAYEMFKGPIPPGLHLDHLCRNRRCVNPSHLEPVTQQENIRRGAMAIVHCPSGHRYTEPNLRRRPDGSRYCRECNRLNAEKRRERGKNAQARP